MQISKQELHKMMGKNQAADSEEDFNSDAYDSFQKIQKTAKSFDDGTSKKKNYNTKKSIKKTYSQH